MSYNFEILKNQYLVKDILHVSEAKMMAELFVLSCLGNYIMYQVQSTTAVWLPWSHNATTSTPIKFRLSQYHRHPCRQQQFKYFWKFLFYMSVKRRNLGLRIWSGASTEGEPLLFHLHPESHGRQKERSLTELSDIIPLLSLLIPLRTYILANRTRQNNTKEFYIVSDILVKFC